MANKTILHLIPGAGEKPKELRTALDLTDTLLTALLASLGQLHPPVLAKMRSHLLLMQMQAIPDHPANRNQQEAINQAIQFIDDLLSAIDSRLLKRFLETSQLAQIRYSFIILQTFIHCSNHPSDQMASVFCRRSG